MSVLSINFSYASVQPFAPSPFCRVSQRRRRLLVYRFVRLELAGVTALELDMGRIESGQFGSGWVTKLSVFGGSSWVGSSVQCQKYLTNIQFTRKKPIIRRLYFVMIRSCNIAIYYRLIIYANIKDVLSGQKGSGAWTDDVGIWVKKSLDGPDERQAERFSVWWQTVSRA